jgi:HPt (histidine-containing phosphotransfer) domain-containing protein
MKFANRKSAAPSVTLERGDDHVVIHPRNLLKAKAVVMMEGPAILDETAVLRAEKALQGLAGHFNGWMEESTRQLSEAWEKQRAANDGKRRTDELFRFAHDMRGQAATLGFPLAGRVASSLCAIFESPAIDINSRLISTVIDKHVDAIKAITREGVTKAEHPIGEILANELEALTEKILAWPIDGALH